MSKRINAGMQNLHLRPALDFNTEEGEMRHGINWRPHPDSLETRSEDDDYDPNQYALSPDIPSNFGGVGRPASFGTTRPGPSSGRAPKRPPKSGRRRSSQSTGSSGGHPSDIPLASLLVPLAYQSGVRIERQDDVVARSKTMAQFTTKGSTTRNEDHIQVFILTRPAYPTISLLPNPNGSVLSKSLWYWLEVPNSPLVFRYNKSTTRQGATYPNLCVGYPSMALQTYQFPSQHPVAMGATSFTYYISSIISRPSHEKATPANQPGNVQQKVEMAYNLATEALSSDPDVLIDEAWVSCDAIMRSMPRSISSFGLKDEPLTRLLNSRNLSIFRILDLIMFGIQIHRRLLMLTSSADITVDTHPHVVEQMKAISCSGEVVYAAIAFGEAWCSSIDTPDTAEIEDKTGKLELFVSESRLEQVKETLTEAHRSLDWPFELVQEPMGEIVNWPIAENWALGFTLPGPRSDHGLIAALLAASDLRAFDRVDGMDLLKESWATARSDIISLLSSGRVKSSGFSFCVPSGSGKFETYSFWPHTSMGYKIVAPLCSYFYEGWLSTKVPIDRMVKNADGLWKRDKAVTRQSGPIVVDHHPVEKKAKVSDSMKKHYCGESSPSLELTSTADNIKVLYTRLDQWAEGGSGNINADAVVFKPSVDTGAAKVRFDRFTIKVGSKHLSAQFITSSSTGKSISLLVPLTHNVKFAYIINCSFAPADAIPHPTNVRKTPIAVTMAHSALTSPVSMLAYDPQDRNSTKKVVQVVDTSASLDMAMLTFARCSQAGADGLVALPTSCLGCAFHVARLSPLGVVICPAKAAQ